MLKFSGRHFTKDIILCCVRWYIAYPLSYRNLQEIMSERGVSVHYSTLNRWVVEYAPKLEKRFRRYKKPVNNSWRLDETYIKIRNQWVYLYRAVDKYGDTIDFYLSEARDQKAALKFLRKSIGANGLPRKVVIDGSLANKSALDLVNAALTGVSQFRLI